MELTRLKQQPGKNITISGSATLVRSLWRDRLLDELQVLVCPIVLGAGKRLFEDSGQPTSLKLVDSKAFSTGMLSLVYAPAGMWRPEWGTRPRTAASMESALGCAGSCASTGKEAA